MVKVEKIDTADDPAHETADWENYVEGKSNPKSLPIEYTVKGKFVRRVKLNAPLIVRRWSRNGEEVEGALHTTALQSIKKTAESTIVRTHNSVYKITEI